MSYKKIEELTHRLTVYSKADGIVFEAYEDLGNGVGRVRAFKPEPGSPNPEESIVEVTMAYNGTDPQGEPLVEIVEDLDEAPVYISDNALAIASFLLSDLRPHWAG